MSDETTLLSCPFCGGEAKLIQADNPSYTPHRDGWYVICKCGASLGFHGNDDEYNTYGDFPHELCAIQAWNTRAELVSGTCKNVAREWEKTSFAHAGTSFCCSECGAHYVDVECYYAGLADKDEEQIRTNFCPNCGREVVGE